MRLLSSAGVAEADSIVLVVSPTSPWLALCLMLGLQHMLCVCYPLQVLLRLTA
jgi:hypothetical protein